MEESKEYEDRGLLQSMNSSRQGLKEKSTDKLKKRRRPFDEEEEDKEAPLFSHASDQVIEDVDSKDDIKFYNEPAENLHSHKDLLSKLELLINNKNRFKRFRQRFTYFGFEINQKE